MKKIEDIKNQEWKLTSPEIDKINFVMEELTFVKENPTITEDSVRRLKNASRELQSVEELFSNKIINLLKQHHMID